MLGAANLGTALEPLDELWSPPAGGIAFAGWNNAILGDNVLASGPDVGKPYVERCQMFPDHPDRNNAYRHWRMFQLAPMPETLPATGGRQQAEGSTQQAAATGSRQQAAATDG